ncbi:MAG: hypothetical protein Q8R37_06045 [Nanoarchaeota archaeon]|nr:hypothetical protein [Nanoarchaeota archaeon]
MMLLIPLLINVLNNNPLLMGEESYYHLQQAQSLHHWSYFPLYLITQLLHGDFIAIIPILMASCCLAMYLQIARQTHLSQLFSIFFFLFVIFSPAFIFTFATISAYSYFTFLTLAGFLLLTHSKKRYHYCSIIPFILAAVIDIFSAFLIGVLLMIYFYHYKQEQPKFVLLLMAIIVLVALLNIFVFQQVFILGPFHHQQRIADLITDLGGRSGISFFVLFMAFIGVIAARKNKKIYGAYLLTALLIPAYMYSTQVIFPVTIMTALFATVGFLTLFEKKWIFDSLRKLTLLLFIISVFFSSLSYMDRITLTGPSGEEREVLQWIQENTPPQAVVFSAPEKGDYIRYFSQRPAFVDLQKSNENLIKNDYDLIMMAVYPDELFPLLEKNDISVIYITPEMKELLPADYGLLTILKNEKFKLVHSRGDLEVWVFRQNDDFIA